MELYVVINDLNHDILGTYYSMNDALQYVEDDKLKRDFYSYCVVVINSDSKSVYEFRINNVD